MRKSRIILIVVIGLLSLQSCSRNFHLKTLQSCRTRDDVSRHFGLPGEEINGPTTEWIYNLASHRDSVTGRAFVKKADSAGAGSEFKYYKYLAFTFDSNGNVTGYISNVKDPIRTINKNYENLTAWKIVGLILATGALVYLDTITKGHLSF